MKHLKFDNTTLTAEIFYSAFLSLPESEKESFLSRLFNSFSSQSVAYTAEGKPLSKKQYIQHIENISNQVKEGDFISHEDILKQLENE